MGNGGQDGESLFLRKMALVAYSDSPFQMLRHNSLH